MKTHWAKVQFQLDNIGWRSNFKPSEGSQFQASFQKKPFLSLSNEFHPLWVCAGKAQFSAIVSKPELS